MPYWHLTSAKKCTYDWYGPVVYRLTSLEMQKTILKVCGPKWYTFISLRAPDISNSIENLEYKKKLTKMEKQHS